MITDTIQNALKRLFCSIGGNADNVRNKDDINAILDEMSALALGEQIKEAGASTLPAVTNSDNGKILKVASGKWGKAYPTDTVPVPQDGDSGKVLTALDDYGTYGWRTPSGGGGTPFIVTLTMASEAGGTMDKTPAEITAAVGQPIYLMLGTKLITATSAELVSGVAAVSGTLFAYNGEDYLMARITTSAEESTWSAAYYTLTPAV
jgi:hypothetical protein